MGSVNKFHHPLVRVTMLVLLVTTAAAVFSTSVVLFVDVLEKENTFLGARSNGVRTILEPVAESISTIASESSVLSALPSSESLVFVVKLDSEAVLIRDMLLFLGEEVSRLTSAARTSGAKEFHASRTDVERVAELSPIVVVSSLDARKKDSEQATRAKHNDKS